jgi:hypothetical protein
MKWLDKTESFVRKIERSRRASSTLASAEGKIL